MNTNTKVVVDTKYSSSKKTKSAPPSAVSNLAHLSEKPPNYFSSPVKQTRGLYFLEIYFRSSALQPVGPSSKSKQCTEAEFWRKPPTYEFFFVPIFFVF